MCKLCSQTILNKQSGTKLSLNGLISTTNRIHFVFIYLKKCIKRQAIYSELPSTFIGMKLQYFLNPAEPCST